MNIRTILKKMLTDASVYFTLIAALYSLLMLIVNVAEEEVLLSAERLLLIFLFAVLAAMAQGLYRVPKLHGAVRLIAHYAILALAFYLCFLLPASMTASQVLIGLFAFTVIYAIVMGVAAFFRARFRANAEQEAPYASQFKKNR